jgi:hypothetical protein
MLGIIQVLLYLSHLKIDSEGRLRTKLSDKRDDFNFPIVNFPFIRSNIPAAPAYGVYISQMIKYSGNIYVLFVGCGKTQVLDCISSTVLSFYAQLISKIGPVRLSNT